MEHYLVSARKYRPASFASVVGQKALTATLKNAIATGRLAHSYLFCGSRGVGKTTCARIFAKTINCEHPTPDGEACNQCRSCQDFNAGRSLNIIEMDAASNNSVDDIRALTEQVMTPPINGKFRVFIIDEVHMLTQAAFNAFLKTLEEPPAHAIFILATTEKQKIIPTILSRCQIYDFSTITIRDIVDHLTYVAANEGISVEPAALGAIARKADGAMRDALSIFDQVAASTRGNITYHATLESLNVLDYRFYVRLADMVAAGKVLDTWLLYKEVRDRGFDSMFFLQGIASFFRNMMVARQPQTLPLLDTDPEEGAALTQAAAKFQPEQLLRCLDLLGQADLHYRTAAGNKQFVVELTLARLCQLCSPSPAKPANGEGLTDLQPIGRPTEASPSVPQPTASAPSPQAAPRTETRPVQPAPVPQMRKAAPQPAPRPGMAARPRLNPIVPKQPEQQSAPATLPQTEGHNKFSAQDLKKAWEDFADDHLEEAILVATMRASIPEPAPDGAYVVGVDNPMQLNRLTQWGPTIEAHLRRQLENSSIALRFEIKSGPPQTSALTDREALALMAERNPELRKFVSDFHLTLS